MRPGLNRLGLAAVCVCRLSRGLCLCGRGLWHYLDALISGGSPAANFAAIAWRSDRQEPIRSGERAPEQGLELGGLEGSTATHMQYTAAMKTAVIPQVRVAPQLRADLESVLREGETLSEFVEASMKSAVEFRRMQASFQAQGEAAWQQFQRTRQHVAAGEVIAKLQGRLDAKRQQMR